MSRYNKRRIFPSLIFMITVCAVFGYSALYVSKKVKLLQNKVILLASELTKKTSVPKKVAAPAVVAPASITTRSWISVQNEIKNTVVKVVTDVAAFNWLEPYKTPAVSKGSGSGFFINADGDVVTNYHVVNQARLVQIEIPALGVERLEVTIVGASPERDLALLRLTERSKQKIKAELGDIPFLQYGNSDEVRRGQEVLALGYPLGVQSLKSTQGIVSGREKVKKQSCIQTTAPLNPGNSGGPAINASGQVIGINFAGIVQAQNVGYIIPINDVKSAIKDLNKIKLLRRPVLGCLLEPANNAMLRYLGNPDPGGFYVAKVYKNMIFEKVGMQEGDMIYELNGFTLDKFGRATVPWNEDKVSMVDILARLEVGDKVDMVVYRKGERKEVEFILEPRLIQPIRYIYPDFEEIDYETIAGAVVMQLAQNHIPLLAENSHGLISYEAPEKQHEPAIIISYVQPTSLLSKLRLLYPGLIITQVNGEPVKTLDEFRAAVRKSKSTRFLSIRTSDHLFVVFSTDNVVADEDRLAHIYQFKKSALIDEIA